MSESCYNGESPNFSKNNRTSYGESPSVQNYTSSPKQAKTNKLEETKNKLKEIEAFVLSNISQDHVLSKIFVDNFRDFVVNNEKEVLKYANTSFFIEKFEALDIDLKYKEKILEVLFEHSNLERKNNSKLKYW